MKIGILGAGNIGGTLGKRLAAQGHEVVLGVRDPQSATAQAAQGADLRVVSIADAARFGTIVVVALPLDAAQQVLSTLDLAGKIVIDTTNAFGGPPAGYPSAGAAIAAWSPGAQVVKAFNATPWEALADPVYSGMAVETYICGDDAQAKAVVAQLGRDIGFVVVDIGGLSNAVLTEHFARLWGTIAYQAGYGRNVAFKLLPR